MLSSAPKNMKAFVAQNGQALIKQVTRPKATRGTIVIKNRAFGINFADTLQLHGKYPTDPSGTLGIESAGDVVEVGEGVTCYKVGDRVLALSSGSHAEYSLVTNLNIYASKIPPGITYEEAASFGITGLTAITMVERGYPVKKGDVILVHAAAGGVGSLLVQLLHKKGATVIASVGSDEKAKFVKKLGADYIINYKKEKVLDRVLEITNGKGVHAALDSIGGITLEESIQSLRNMGVVISYGFASGPAEPIQVANLYSKNIRLQGSTLWAYFEDKEDSEKYWSLFFSLLGSKSLTVKIHKTYAFEEIPIALADIASGNTLGKLLVKIN